MFANINFGVINFAFPDVCKTPTPAGPVPLPYPNFAFSETHIPSVFNIVIGGGLVENLTTEGTLSTGDEPGAAGGVLSGVIKGPDQYVLGSFTVMMGGMPAMRLTSLTTQNGTTPNAVGLSATPGQTSVVVLS